MIGNPTPVFRVHFGRSHEVVCEFTTIAEVIDAMHATRIAAPSDWPQPEVEGVELMTFAERQRLAEAWR